MPRDIRLYLHEIVHAIDKINKYAHNISFSEFKSDSFLQDGIIRNLEIIGEAVKLIPNSLKNDFHEVPWKEIAGFRDIAIHQYFSIDLEIVWDIIKVELLNLRDHIILIEKKLNSD